MHDPDADPVCPLCLRPIPPDARQSLHHLTPKLRGGKGGPTQICHDEIHATLSDTELARAYSTVETLRSQPRLAAFLRAGSEAAADFHSRSAGKRRR